MAKKNFFVVTTRYNEEAFRKMLSNHSNERNDTKLSDDFITQCIAALLDCRDHNKFSKEISKMEALLSNLGIEFDDVRSHDPEDSKKEPYTYKREPKDYNPAYAVQVFNELMCPI